MEAVAFPNGSFVLYPGVGPCRVRGVQADVLAGQCLTLASLVHPNAVVRVPVSKLASASISAVTAEQARSTADTWQPPSGAWKNRKHVPVNVQRVRRINALRAIHAQTG